MANVFSSNPIQLVADTTVGTNTDWKGVSSGNGTASAASLYNGGLGIRPVKIVVFSNGTIAPGNVVISRVNSARTATDVNLLTLTINTSQPFPYEIDMQEVGAAAWSNFIVTGLSAGPITNVGLLIYYRT